MYFVTTKTHAHADGSKIRVLGTCDKRAEARAKAAEHNGTVRTQEEIDALISGDRLDLRTVPGYVAPEVIVATPAPTKPVTVKAADKAADHPIPAPADWVELAKQVKATTKAANTIGRKEKFLKRVFTEQAVLDVAATFLADLLTSAPSKVVVVRALAAWEHNGVKLQRRDLYALIRARAELATLADATISTQFQLVRSGKLLEKAAAK